MKKWLIIFSLICLNFILVKSQEGKSKVKVGYDFFDKVLEVLTKKVLYEINQKSESLPDMSFAFKVVNFIPVNVSLKNMTFSEIPFVDRQLSINHISEDLVSINLSK